MVFTKFAPFLALAALAASDVSAMPRVDRGVHRALREQATVDLMITMKTGVDSAISSIKEADFATRGQKIAALVTTLEVTTKTAQSSLDSLLAKEATSTHTSHETFWISNQKVIKGATIELVEKLAAIPDIAEIREEVRVSLPRITVASNATRASVQASEPEWGVTKVDAPSVWAAGVTGQNVVIGSLDTGVVATHTSIAANFRSSHNWLDVTANKTEPYDDVGHGTHTIGTMVGSNGVGVAPGAKFIACKAFTEDGASESWLLRCAQFMTCPTDASGNNQDCSQAPHIVSNSWGSSNGAAWFESSIKAWRAANIIPVFANGNSGPWCSTTLAPADSPDVIAVGATDSDDKLAVFSSKGPTTSGVIKPDLSAPGEDVRSAWNTSDTAFETISGTSMATPHVSGVIALLLSKKPTLTYDQIMSALGSTTERSTLKRLYMKCNGIAETQFPNNQYGYGRVNAFSAYKSIA